MSGAHGGRPGPARIGVIGCGWWSTRAHLPALTAHPDAVIAGIADPDPARRAAAAAAFGIPPERCFASHEDLLAGAQLDGAIVAVPHHLHAPVATAVLERDLHLLLEKPMTIDPADARRVAALAEARGREIILSYGWHWNPQALALRERIAAGAVGRLEFVAAQYASVARALYAGDPEPYRDVLGMPVAVPGSRTYADPSISGGGQGQTQTTHLVALLAWITGLRPVAVSAMTEAFGLEVDLVNAVSVRFAGGAVASIGSTGSVTPAQPETLTYRLYGTEGHAEWDVYAGRASIHHRDGSVERLPDLDPAETYPERAPALDLVSVCLGRASSGSPAWIGVLATEVVDAIYRSARSGCVVPLDPPSGSA